MLKVFVSSSLLKDLFGVCFDMVLVVSLWASNPCHKSLFHCSGTLMAMGDLCQFLYSNYAFDFGDSCFAVLSQVIVDVFGLLKQNPRFFSTFFGDDVDPPGFFLLGCFACFPSIKFLSARATPKLKASNAILVVLLLFW